MKAHVLYVLTRAGVHVAHNLFAMLSSGPPVFPLLFLPAMCAAVMVVLCTLLGFFRSRESPQACPKDASLAKRSFSWLDRCRRLWKKCERTLTTSLQMLELACVAFLLRRL